MEAGDCYIDNSVSSKTGKLEEICSDIDLNYTEKVKRFKSPSFPADATLIPKSNHCDCTRKKSPQRKTLLQPLQ